MGKAKLHIRFAERRAAEIAEMACQGKSDKISALTEQTADHLGKVCVAEREKKIRQEGRKATHQPAVPPPAPAEGTEDYSVVGGHEEELKIMLNESRARSLNILENALEEAPPAAKPNLQKAIENIAKDYDRTISIIESGSSP
jgi:hypothetical protein